MFVQEREGTRPFDRVFAALCLPLAVALPVAVGLDAVRFGRSSVPFERVYPGVALNLPGDIPVPGSPLTNPHPETAVGIQDDRDHKVAAAASDTHDPQAGSRTPPTAFEQRPSRGAPHPSGTLPRIPDGHPGSLCFEVRTRPARPGVVAATRADTRNRDFGSR